MTVRPQDEEGESWQQRLPHFSSEKNIKKLIELGKSEKQSPPSLGADPTFSAWLPTVPTHKTNMNVAMWGAH